jgi:shikimate kinase
VQEDGGFISRGPAYRPKDLKPSVCPLTIVCGPPGSGKSTWVNRRKAPGDCVIDLDEIRAAITDKPLYNATDELSLQAAVVQRNYMLHDISWKLYDHAYFILGAPTAVEREWWSDRLKPVDVIVLNTPLEECIKRIQSDSRRPENIKRQHIAAAQRWWQRYTPGGGFKSLQGT